MPRKQEKSRKSHKKKGVFQYRLDPDPDPLFTLHTDTGDFMKKVPPATWSLSDR